MGSVNRSKIGTNHSSENVSKKLSWMGQINLDQHWEWHPTAMPTWANPFIIIKYKANLRALKDATGLVILLKLDSNRRCFSLCDLEIWWMTSKNNRASLLCYVKLCASFQNHWWIKTENIVRKRSIQVKIGVFFFYPCDLEKQYTRLSCVHHFEAIGEFKLELQPGNTQFGSKSPIFFFFFYPMWPSNLTDDLGKQ